MDHDQNKAISRIFTKLLKKHRIHGWKHHCVVNGEIPWVWPKSYREFKRFNGALPEIKKRLTRTCIACGYCDDLYITGFETIHLVKKREFYKKPKFTPKLSAFGRLIRDNLQF